MAEYKVLISGVQNKDGERFEQGEIITDKDFPKYVLEHWADNGRVQLVKADKLSLKKKED